MQSSFRLGGWLVEPHLDRLVRGDEEIKLEPKVMEVLVYLCEHAEEVIPKGRIIEDVWEGAFVTDEVLANSIWELRKALGDDAREPRFIQTVPKKGYRLIAAVTGSGPAGGIGSPSTLQGMTRWVFVAALLVLGVSVAAWLIFFSSQPAGPLPRSVPLTSLPGVEQEPALSPDGKQVAFVWNRGKGPRGSHIYVKLVGGGDPLQLTQASSNDFYPAWSPDGSKIAFLRVLKWGIDGECEVLEIPALGGRERRLGTIATGPYPGWTWVPGLDWSPDGKFLAVVDRGSPGDPPGIYLLSTDKGDKRRLTEPPPGIRLGDMRPSFSPDGKSVAFVRSPGAAGGQVYLQPADGGPPQVLVADEQAILDLDWVADGSALVFVAIRETGREIWKVSAAGGAPERLPYGELAWSVSVAGIGNRLAYDRRTMLDSDIWRIGGPSSKEKGPPTKLIASARDDWAQEFSPDGTRITFVSGRSGKQNIWVCDSDGTTNCSQLSDMERAVFPRWSPDGQSVAFSCEQGVEKNICVTDVEGGFTRRLTDDGSSNTTPSWSHDGRWVYFASRRTGADQVWKIPAEGGESVQLTEHGGIRPREWDGRFLYYENKGIRRVPLDGSQETVILEQPDFEEGLWTLWGKSLVYLHVDSDEKKTSIELLDLETRRMTPIASLEPGDFWYGLTVSPDGRWILFSRDVPQTSDLMLVENFR